jgi:hypothetical protein
MNRFLKRLFRTATRAVAPLGPCKSTFKPQCERLDDRLVPTVTSSFSNGTLTISILEEGPTHTARVGVTTTNEGREVTVIYDDHSIYPYHTGHTPPEVTRLVVNGTRFNDVIDLAGVNRDAGFSGLNDRITIHTGGGDNFVIGSAFADRIFCGSGHSQINCTVGDDQAWCGDGPHEEDDIVTDQGHVTIYNFNPGRDRVYGRAVIHDHVDQPNPVTVVLPDGSSVTTQLNNDGTLVVSSSNGSQRVLNNIVSFVPNADGSVVALDTNDTLWYATATTAHVMSNNVFSYDVNSDGGVAVLDANDTLWYGTAQNAHAMLNNTVSYSVNSDGNVIALDVTHTLWYGTAHDASLLEQNVRSFCLGWNEHLYALLQNGDLERINGSVHTVLAHAIQRIWIGGGGYTLFAQKFDGTTLWFEV